MVDTPRTQAYLLASDFEDGQPAGSIGPIDMRELIVSMPMPNIIKAPFRPDFPGYNAKFDGGSDDTAAWTSMFTDIAARGWGEILMPAGTSLVRPGQLNMPPNVYWRGQGTNGSILQRFGSTGGTLLNVSGTTAAAADGGRACLQDFQINGSGTINGTLIQMYYCIQFFMERMQVVGTNGAGLQMVQVWDSVFSETFFDNCALNTSATAFTTSSADATGSIIGSEAIQILSATAASGFGSSSDSTNQVRFVNCLVEGFSAGAIVLASTTYNASNGAYNIEFLNTKIESSDPLFTGKYGVAVGDHCDNVRFENTHLAIINPSGANAGAQQAMVVAGGTGNVVKNLRGYVANTQLQSYVKAVGSGSPWFVDGINEPGGGAGTSVAALWVTGTAPDWNDISLGTSSNQVSPYYPPRFPSQYTAPKAVSDIAGAATPGSKAFANIPNVVYRVYTVTAGAFIQLDTGVAAPQSREITILNATASTISIKPPTGGTVAGGATNAVTTMAAGSRRTFNSTDVLTWY